MCGAWRVLQIHWFSIINSCVTVLLLTGFLATILLRVLKNDFLKYTRDDEMGEEADETVRGTVTQYLSAHCTSKQATGTRALASGPCTATCTDL